MTPENERDLRILIEGLRGQLTVLNSNLVHQSELIRRTDDRLQRLENCPCPVHRDPGVLCPIEKLQNSVHNLEARLNYYMGGIMVAGIGFQLFLQYFLKN